MPAANEFDTGGGVFSNLWNDIKKIPERRIQDSRQLRANAHYQAIRDQAQQSEVQKRMDDEALSRWQTAYGERPAPTTPDGRPNRAVMNGMLRQFEELNGTENAVKKTYALGEAGRNLKLAGDAEDVLGTAIAPEQIGKDRRQAQAANAPSRMEGAMQGLAKGLQEAGNVRQGVMPEINQPQLGAPAEGEAPGPFANVGSAIRDAMEKKRIENAAAESRARAEATAPFENRYSQGDNMAVNGQFVGRAARDQRTGSYGIVDDKGQMKAIPEGAQPITATAINKNIVGANDFKKFKTDLTDSERSLRQFERYASSVGGLEPGIAGLADKVTAGFKSLISGGQLDPQELARAAATGQLQGLLGGNRVSVVGGGVMTETDAARIIQRLGGDVGALQNRDVVMKALGELYQDRFAQYQDDVNFYNESVDSYWGSKGFKRATPTDFNSLFGQAAVNGSAMPAPAPGAPQSAAPASKFKVVKIE
jgi:hypothetical protein